VAACSWDQGDCPEEVTVTVIYDHKSNFKGIKTSWTDTVTNTWAAQQAISNSKGVKTSNTGSSVVASTTSKSIWTVASSSSSLTESASTSASNTISSQTSNTDSTSKTNSASSSNTAGADTSFGNTQGSTTDQQVQETDTNSQKSTNDVGGSVEASLSVSVEKEVSAGFSGFGASAQASVSSTVNAELGSSASWNRAVEEAAQKSLQTMVSQSSTGSSTTGGGTTTSQTNTDNKATTTDSSQTSSAGQSSSNTINSGTSGTTQSGQENGSTTAVGGTNTIGNVNSREQNTLATSTSTTGSTEVKQFTQTHTLENTCPNERPHLWQEGYYIQSNRNWESHIYQKSYWCTPFHKSPLCPSLAFCKNEQCSECCKTADGVLEKCGEQHQSVGPTSNGKTQLEQNLAITAIDCSKKLNIPGALSADERAWCQKVIEIVMGRRLLMK